MAFKDREDAGRRLAAQLTPFANRDDVLILAIPRGGVSVAFEIAKALHVRLDVFLASKLGVPGHEELAFGAITAGDGRFLDEQIVQSAQISAGQIEQITEAAKSKLQERSRLYRENRPSPALPGKTVILVDDGIATGASMFASIHALREMKPARLIVAIPVAPKSTCNWLRPLVDELVCLHMPKLFYAVGQFYERFDQMSDEEVVDLLRRSEMATDAEADLQEEECFGGPVGAEWSTDTVDDEDVQEIEREVSIPVGQVRVEGTLCIPRRAKGIVLFVHGSGSGRHSPRNRQVAEALRARGFATLLFDLLTKEEEAIDRWNAELRFNIDLLSSRLVRVTNWIVQQQDTKGLSVGYFGASTGAAAALVAAAKHPELVTVVVSRGGRPDLAADALGKVHAATLLLVGGLDGAVIGLNRQALARLQCANKRLVVIPGAAHLFEEPGKLEQVAEAAADWFANYLVLAGGMKAAVAR